MLRRTDKQIRTSIFTLQRMTGHKCNIEELMPNRFYKFDLIGGIPNYYKINLAYKACPIRLEVRYGSLAKGLRFFGSFKAKEPSPTQCDYQKHGKHAALKIYPKGDEHAESFGTYEWFYMSIESD